MMTKIGTTGLALGLALSVAPFAASAQEAGDPLLCALTEVLECVDGYGCQPVEPEAIGAPRFLRVDADGKRIADPKADDQAPGSTVVHSERIDGKLILQGTDPGVEDLRDGVAWTVAIGEDSGGMVLTAAGDEVAYVAFGECLSTP